MDLNITPHNVGSVISDVYKNPKMPMFLKAWLSVMLNTNTKAALHASSVLYAIAKARHQAYENTGATITKQNVRTELICSPSSLPLVKVVGQ